MSNDGKTSRKILSLKENFRLSADAHFSASIYHEHDPLDPDHRMSRIVVVIDLPRRIDPDDLMIGIAKSANPPFLVVQAEREPVTPPSGDFCPDVIDGIPEKFIATVGGCYGVTEHDIQTRYDERAGTFTIDIAVPGKAKAAANQKGTAFTAPESPLVQ